MKQQVNLYTFTPTQSIWRQYSPFPQAALGLLLVLLVVTLFTWQDKSKLQSELQALQARHDQLAQQVTKLNGLTDETTVEKLQSDVDQLRAELALRQATMTSIKSEGAANSQGFSLYLEGLARQHFDGLWLTTIQLYQGGERLGLTGIAGEPEMVPRYVRKLGNENVFAGSEFDVFSLQRLPGSTALAFDVTAISEIEP